jgi:hypothetical protein
MTRLFLRLPLIGKATLDILITLTYLQNRVGTGTPYPISINTNKHFFCNIVEKINYV